jgi:sugar lactone lactonase YvrE
MVEMFVFLFQVLMDGLSFVNGMEMSPNGEFLLLCETGRARIHKYYLKGNTVITKLLLGKEDKKSPNVRGYSELLLLTRQ